MAAIQEPEIHGCECPICQTASDTEVVRQKKYIKDGRLLSLQGVSKGCLFEPCFECSSQGQQIFLMCVI